MTPLNMLVIVGCLFMYNMSLVLYTNKYALSNAPAWYANHATFISQNSSIQLNFYVKRDRILVPEFGRIRISE